MRKFTVGICMVILAGALTACGAGTQESSPAESIETEAAETVSSEAAEEETAGEAAEETSSAAEETASTEEMSNAEETLSGGRNRIRFRYAYLPGHGNAGAYVRRWNRNGVFDGKHRFGYGGGSD